MFGVERPSAVLVALRTGALHTESLNEHLGPFVCTSQLLWCTFNILSFIKAASAFKGFIKYLTSKMRDCFEYTINFKCQQIPKM